MINEKIMRIMLLLVFVQSLNAQQLKVKWEKEFAVKEGYSAIPHEMVYDNGSLNVLGVSYENKTYKEGKFWHWKISADGEKKSAIDIGSASSDKRSALSWKTKGVVVNKGNVVTAGEFSSNSTTIIISDGASEKSVLKNKMSSDVKEDKWNMIFKMSQIHNGDIVFVGNNSKTEAAIALYSVDGKRMWNKVYGEGERSYFSDAVELNGNTYVAGAYGTGDNEARNYKCVLYKCDKEGNVLAKSVFDGGGLYMNKYPQLAIFGDAILLCYDKNPALNRPEVMVVRYNEKLEKQHEFCVYTSDKRVISLNKFAVMPSKGLVFAHSLDTSIVVDLFSMSGEKLSSVTLLDYAVLDGVNLTCLDNMVFVAAMSVPLDMSYGMNTKICALELIE